MPIIADLLAALNAANRQINVQLLTVANANAALYTNVAVHGSRATVLPAEYQCRAGWDPSAVIICHNHQSIDLVLLIVVNTATILPDNHQYAPPHRGRSWTPSSQLIRRTINQHGASSPRSIVDL
jgi:hypothetical protein